MARKSKQQLSAEAHAWYTHEKELHADEISKSTENTKIITRKAGDIRIHLPSSNYHTSFIVLNTDTVSGIQCVEEPRLDEIVRPQRKKSVLPFYYLHGVFDSTVKEDHIGVLNFASFKKAGGGFLNGAVAQEEDLCRKSFLYHVLEAKPEFYKDNMEYYWNHSLYADRAVYTPDVIFSYGHNEYGKASVITCAAPNKKAYMEADLGVDVPNEIREGICQAAMADRINFILEVARMTNITTLILGAFGCGVFGNSVDFVAPCFMEQLTNEYKGQFDRVVFAILGNPHPNSAYQKFVTTVKAYT